jgi:hypothetical protein
VFEVGAARKARQDSLDVTASELYYGNGSFKALQRRAVMLQEKTLARAKRGTGSPVDFSGTWVNELQSKMALTQTNDIISGVYESSVSSGGGTATGDLQGYVDGDLISFVVHWRDFQAITAWVGQLDPSAPQPTINTLWQMTQQVAVGEEWASINAGADTFTRM